MRSKFIVLFLLFFTSVFSQKRHYGPVLEAVAQYGVADPQVKDSLWENMVIPVFKREIEKLLFGDASSTVMNGKYEDDNVIIREMYNIGGRFAIHSISANMDYWNYVTFGFLDYNTIILENKDFMKYYVDIHDLDDNAFLLISRQDDMSYSCYEASVMQYDPPNHNLIRLGAFANGQDTLSVCSWTNVDLSYPGKKDPKTGLPVMNQELVHYDPLVITFNSKTKTISYSFFSQANGKKIIRKAKYLNGKFDIKSYDARAFEE